MANSTVFSKVRETMDEFEVIQVLDNVQAATTTSDEVDVQNVKYLCLYVHGNSTAVSGGTVVVEGSPITAHPGAWKTLGTVTVAGGRTLQAVAVTDGDDGFPTRYVRVRVSGQVANGNVDAYLVLQR